MSKFNLPSPYVLYDPMADSNNSVSPLYNKVKIPALVVSEVQMLQYVSGSMFVGYVNIMIRSTGQFVCVQLPSLTIIDYSIWLGDDIDAVILKSFKPISNDLINVKVPLTEELRTKYSKILDKAFATTIPSYEAVVRAGCVDAVSVWNKFGH